jgi:hypothetical protein
MESSINPWKQRASGRLDFGEAQRLQVASELLAVANNCARSLPLSQREQELFTQHKNSADSVEP